MIIKQHSRTTIILESTLVQNASWVMGYDLKAAESGFTVKSR